MHMLLETDFSDPLIPPMGYFKGAQRPLLFFQYEKRSIDHGLGMFLAWRSWQPGLKSVSQAASATPGRIKFLP